MPQCYISGVIGEILSAASISIAKIIEEIPVVTQMAYSLSTELDDYTRFYRTQAGANGLAKVMSLYYG